MTINNEYDCLYLLPNDFLLVQGRTLPQENNLLQSFPSKWKNEFPLLSSLGFDGIEWIYDKYSENTNPILTSDGRKEMKNLSYNNNIQLENIVFDWFIEFPLFVDEKLSPNTCNKLKSLIILSANVGFKKIIFPILESNNISTSKMTHEFINFCKNTLAPLLNEYDIEFHLETSLSPSEELELLQSIDHPKFFLCFDMGNSASLGFEPSASLDLIQNFLGSVHIKDRLLDGGSVHLGTGAVDFHQVFSKLQQINFSGPFSFQCFRDADSNNVSLLKQYLKFINDVISVTQDDKKNS